MTFQAGAPLTQTYSWTAPAGTKAGTYTMYVAVFNPAWSALLAQKTTVLTITAATAAAAPNDLEPPVISGTAQVGKVLASTTGTWTGATSFAYQWAGNGATNRGGDGGDVHPRFKRCRTHADSHSYGDRIFGRDGVSDQRSDGPDCGGQYRFASRNH